MFHFSWISVLIRKISKINLERDNFISFLFSSLYATNTLIATAFLQHYIEHDVILGMMSLSDFFLQLVLWMCFGKSLPESSSSVSKKKAGKTMASFSLSKQNSKFGGGEFQKILSWRAFHFLFCIQNLPLPMLMRTIWKNQLFRIGLCNCVLETSVVSIQTFFKDKAEILKKKKSRGLLSPSKW